MNKKFRLLIFLGAIFISVTLFGIVSSKVEAAQNPNFPTPAKCKGADWNIGIPDGITCAGSVSTSGAMENDAKATSIFGAKSRIKPDLATANQFCKQYTGDSNSYATYGRMHRYCNGCDQRLSWYTGSIWDTKKVCSGTLNVQQIICATGCGPTKPPEPPIDDCIWKGHCKGDPCKNYDDCDGDLVCNYGKCDSVFDQEEPCPPQEMQFKEGMITFTFDDGWQSIYNNALPLLDRYGFKSTQYIISDMVDFPWGGYMTHNQILDMQNKGHEIGGHSRTHADLAGLNQAQLIDEISNSKKILESMGISPIISFDYPYGSYNDSVIKTIKDSGYIGARTVIYGDNNKKDDPFLLKALSMEVATPMTEIQRMIDSAVLNKTWLILIFHQIENNGDQYSTAPDKLSQILDYVHQKNAKVVKISEGLSQMSP